ncbi:MAG: hypothetical protein EZS28_026415, partial [Streblomastix strix]
KNFIKANSVYRQARISNPSFILRFVLYCKTKEEGRIGSESGSGEGSGSELSSIAFKTTMAQAIEHHEISRNALKAFFENMTMPTPVYSLMAEHLNTIVEEESQGRKCYEDLLVNHPQNTSVLRNYAKLLMDIYQDEDTADALLTRADRIEDDHTSPGGEHGQDHHDHKEKEDDNAVQDMDSVDGQQNDDDANKMQHNLTQESITGQSQSKSHHHLKQKKKKKKKKKEDNVMTEITSGSSSNSNLGLIIGSLLFGAHVLAIIIYVVSLVIYITQANRYEMRITNLKRVCDVSQFATEFAPLSMMYMVHEFEYNFSYPGSIDGLAGVIRTFNLVQTKMVGHSDSISAVTSNIYEMTTLTQPWEENNLESQIFMTGNARCNDTNGVEVDCEGVVIDHQLQVTNLLRALTLLAQKGNQLGSIKEDPHIMSTYHQDLAYICFNSISPILAACKRAMIAYYEDTKKLTSEIIVIFIVVIVVIMVFELAMLIIIYALFTIKIIRERKDAFKQVLEVPKQKMQGVIRRLLQEEEEEEQEKNDQVFIEGEMNENELDQNYSEYQPLEGTVDNIGHKKRISKIGSQNIQGLKQEQLVQQGDVETNIGDQSKLLTKETSQQQQLMKKSSTIRSNSKEKNKLKRKSQQQDDIQQSKSPSSPQDQQSNIISQNHTPLALNETPPEDKKRDGMAQQKLSDQLQQQQQQQDQNNLAKIPGQTDVSSILKSLGINTGASGSQSQYNSPVIQNTQQSSQNILNSILGIQTNQSPQQNAQQQGTPQLQQMVLFNNLKGSAYSQSANNLIPKSADMVTRSQAVALQSASVGSPLNNLLQQQVGIRPTTAPSAYNLLPSPINLRFVVNIVASLSAELIILAGLIIVVVVYVLLYSGTASDIVMSGMRPAFFAQIHYMCLRLLYPYSQIDPKDNITLKNTNPVWKDQSHVEPNRGTIIRLMIGLIGQLSKVHHTVHYGSSEYTITTDTLLDGMKSSRMNIKQSITALLANSSCLMQDSAKCDDQPGNPEGMG